MDLKVFCSVLTSDEDYSAGIGHLLNDIPKDRKICGIVLFGTDGLTDYHQSLEAFRGSVCNILGRRIPVTLVPQSSLPSGGLSLEIYTLSSDSEVLFDERDGVCYGIMENESYSLLFTEGIASSDFSDGVQSQSDEIFSRMDSLLDSYGFCASDIVRQWNYIGNITCHRDGRQNYQEFNDARSRYYGKVRWDNGYPSATGIGADTDGIIVGCVAFRTADRAACGIHSINNPLQVPAHEYSRDVLVDDSRDAVKSTPKFERAKLIEMNGKAFCFVSGTAAIRGEESMEDSCARQQTIQTLENIDCLVSGENLFRYGCREYELSLANLHVYVKNPEDLEQVKTVVEESYPLVPTVYTVADVCRKELLVEIEGILIS